MRRYKKRQQVKKYNILHEAHCSVKQLIDNGQLVSAILTECQNIAIDIGTFIENEEGEGTASVSELEKYCELLYQFSEFENAGQKLDSQKVYSDLEEVIKKSEYSFNNDIETRVEAVFLPYKASMWDSLESVYFTANDDDNCDAYVIPIPYFDKNKDGTLGKRHYEIDMYPENVPVTNYEDYSFAQRHPDIIYIHNPYDQYNSITTVDPSFYIPKLKQYTDELVYIPYFVSGESVEPHFCVLPGPIFADKVIVENENVRKIYIEEYYKTTGKSDGEEKFLALGSPKYERVARISREDVKIPKDWQEKIEGRKVVLYNTSISGLKRPDDMLTKIENVLKVFKGEEEVVLLWRPHPLYIQSLQNIGQSYVNRYLQIVQDYKRENYGIFDDTSDLERAIAISDAYYGDFGSVPELYKKTGKPLMIQNIDVLEN